MPAPTTASLIHNHTSRSSKVSDMAAADDKRPPVVLHLRGDIDADSQPGYRKLADQ